MDEPYDVWVKKIPDALKDPDYSPYRAAFVFIKDGKIIKVTAFKGVWTNGYNNLSVYRENGKIIPRKFDIDGCTSYSLTKISTYNLSGQPNEILIFAEER